MANDSHNLKEDHTRPLVVGIGASAGGVEAFKAFFSRLPPDTGMVFIIVQHLDPVHASSLPSIVSSYTAMPVLAIEDGFRIKPNHVHIIPPDATLVIEDSILRLTQPASTPARRGSINIFLTSLALDQKENAIGIILSGYGSDGAAGIGAIKEHGGLTLSQAEFDHHAKRGMPQSAVSTGFVDHVLAIEDMPAALLNYQHHRSIFDAANEPRGSLPRDLKSHLTTICKLLNAKLGRDFSQYKTGTLMRRIQRRMHVLRLTEVTAYIEQLQALPQEAEHLLRELLISVTRFFRDASAFEALETHVLADLVDGTGPLRVWVPGCATGEEAFSLAILLKEHQARLGTSREVQIFATDIDVAAITVARTGRYPDAIAADVPPDLLERYFLKEENGYCVTKQIREMCLFSAHDLVKDPPFSKLDLISCRNLLIYFNPSLQNQILTTFHYALKADRYLFLGPSESVHGQPNLFEPLDKKHRVYARTNAPARLPTLPINYNHSNDTSAPRRLPADEIDRRVSRAVAQYAPAFLVVDDNHEVLRFSGQVSKYLAPTSGTASLNLFALLHPDLRPAARATLRRASAKGVGVVYDGASLKLDNSIEPITLTVEPLTPGPEPQVFMIVFQGGSDTTTTGSSPTPLSSPQAPDEAASVTELGETQERLRNVTEELEAANQELQSSNEEYLSVNEELQSSNEELETSKEELQSLNEELQTINVELNSRNESLVRVNSDLANLFNSTSIATLFLDTELKIRRFTPRIADIFRIRPGDEGRDIADIATHLRNNSLVQSIQEVLQNQQGNDLEVQNDAQGSTYQLQIRPYWDGNGGMDGVVLTFVDITERKKHEDHTSLLLAELDHRVKNILAVIMAVVHQTLKTTSGPEAFVTEVSGRIGAIAQAHSLLTESGKGVVELKRILETELAPYTRDDGNVRLTGDTTVLPPKLALSLALVVHELASNAAKYGALSATEGSLAVEWNTTHVDGRTSLVINWNESGGPPVEKPTRRGFGSVLIERALAAEFEAQVHPEYRPEGFRYRIELLINAVTNGAVA